MIITYKHQIMNFHLYPLLVAKSACPYSWPVMDFNEGDGPRFFKLVHESTIAEGKLMVPNKFVRQHGNCLSSPVITLEVPSGAKWEVERLNNEGEIWLGEGWKEFAQHHSLEQDYVIFFKHVEDCHFDVIICDESGLEIEYPDHDSDVVEVIELDMEEEEEEQEQEQEQEQGGEDGIQLVHENCNGKQAIKAFPSITSPALEASDNFTTNYPSFKKVVQPDHLEHSNMNVPVSFIQKHMESKTHTVMLQVADRAWTVKLMYYPSSNMGCLSYGFSKFARENSLVVGDVCVFELIQRNVLKVSIFKSNCTWMGK
ncbi:B3 domain-containing protein Os03g0212300-like isoform X2 [Hevea brasiliensis]|uniref:B3 domain-containing protein Os03g0212300-like isoform X2 n=1 Tax=Hevea brasiliensis TaxID=3981 RepID=UPI0025EBC724|nr:B3 domain-containing protein Os03g0212300-like isoform X2 [Hevea brasiliensis]